jgi:branched chain amino acid efflux pump
LKRIAPVAPASASFGIAFGILASTAGLGSLAPIVMSATTFAGSAQFAAASVLDDGGSVAAAVAAAILLNLRYLAISVAIADAFEGSRPKRALESQLIVDESWAVAQRGGGRVDRRILVAAGLLLYPCWVGATAVGVFGGGLLGNPERFGLDAAFPALFLALLVSVVKTRREIAAALAGGAVALVLLPFARPGVPVIAAAAVCLAGLGRR